jgi:hypothetical protein
VRCDQVAVWSKLPIDLNALQLLVGRISSESRRDLNSPGFRVHGQQVRIEQPVAIPAQEQPAVRLMLRALSKAVEVCCLQGERWLRTRKGTTLAKPLHHSKSESTLASTTTGNANYVTTINDHHGVLRLCKNDRPATEVVQQWL